MESVAPVGDMGPVPEKRTRGRPRKKRDLAGAEKTDTAITKHLKEFPSCLKEVARNVNRHFSILFKARSVLQLQFLEALFISSYNPQLCVQKDHVMSLALF